MMQAFAYQHLVPAQQLLVETSGLSAPRGQLRVLSATPVKIPAGGTARIEVSMPVRGRAVRLELDDPPEGITISKVSSLRLSSEIVLESDAAKVKPGQKGNLIIGVFPAGPGGGRGPRARTPIGSLPAIPFEIVPPTSSATPAAAARKNG